MKNIIYIISILALLFTSSLLAKEETISPTINFTEEAKWPPFTPDKYGYIKEGLSYILMKEVFTRLNIDITLETLPQNRMLKYLELGKKDAATVISKNESRLKYLEFSEPIMQKKGFIYYLKEKRPSFNWNKYEDLKGLKIGIVAGHNMGKEFNVAVKKYQLNIETVSKAEQNFNKLLNDRIDVLLSIEPTAHHFLKNPIYANKIAPASKKYYSKYYYIGFSKKSNAKILLPKVNKVINQMKKDGTLNEILSKYSMSY